MFVKNNFSLKAFNTFGINVYAEAVVELQKSTDFDALFKSGLLKESPVFILGGGSNVLFTKDVDGLVLLNRIKGVSIEKEEDDFIYLLIGAGENWSDLVDLTVDNAWWGIENLSLIPGTVGAAPIQNIGAYGVELKDVIVRLEAFNLKNGLAETFETADCDFGYRTSVFKTSLKGRYLIKSVSLKLSKKPKRNLSYKPLKAAFQDISQDDISIKMISDEVKKIRRSKLPDPEVLGNAGSFFKNPVVPFSKVEKLVETYPEIPFYKFDETNYKLAAGWLIEQCGWKGKRIGDAGVHEKQALVLVNYGGASGKEIIVLSKEIQKSVMKKFGVWLIPEVTILS